MVALHFMAIYRRNTSKVICCLRERIIHRKTSATEFLFHEFTSFYGLCFPMNCEEFFGKFFPRTSLGDCGWISDTIILPFKNLNICIKANESRRKGTRNVESMIKNQGYPLYITKYKAYHKIFGQAEYIY